MSREGPEAQGRGQWGVACCAPRSSGLSRQQGKANALPWARTGTVPPEAQEPLWVAGNVSLSDTESLWAPWTWTELLSAVALLLLCSAPS